ncbi:E3 ubiquitin ligase, partial [Teratosphaeriaceae sp. CCFEE 6253]
LVLIFASRNQLLPDGETAEEHNGFARDEAAIVAKDKANADARTGGLFKGAFSGRRRALPMYDPGDGVERCPRCHWELEEGACGQCGEVVDDDFSDLSSESLDTDEEVDHDFGDFDADLEAGFVGGPIHLDLDTDDEDEDFDAP